VPKIADLAGSSTPFGLPKYTVATLPSAATYKYRSVYCSDAAWSGGTGCEISSNGTNWIDPDGRIATTAVALGNVLEAFTYSGASIVLSRTPVGDVLVFVAGAPQVPSDVTRSGKTISALANAVNGDTVLVYYRGI
jgi:hypothetical protein